jgi:hypothetical protein
LQKGRKVGGQRRRKEAVTNILCDLAPMGTLEGSRTLVELAATDATSIEDHAGDELWSYVGTLQGRLGMQVATPEAADEEMVRVLLKEIAGEWLLQFADFQKRHPLQDVPPMTTEPATDRLKKLLPSSQQIALPPVLAFADYEQEPPPAVVLASDG